MTNTLCFFFKSFDMNGVTVTGSVCVDLSGNNLNIRLASLDHFATLNSTRIWIGKDLQALPRNSDGSQQGWNCLRMEEADDGGHHHHQR